MDCRPSQHFLPTHDDFGELTLRVEELVTVPIRRVKHVPQWTGDPPFLVYACGWAHLNEYGPLTREKFEKDLQGAIEDFAADINKHPEFIAYPITHVPPQTEAKSFYDWCGATHPFDLRAVVMYDENLGQDIPGGLKFYINTLISPEMTKNVGVNP